MPLWSAVIVGKRSSNAPVESWFRTTNKCISPSRTTPGTFIRNLCKSVHGRLADIEKQKHQKKRDTHQIADDPCEYWAKKQSQSTKRSNGYFSKILKKNQMHSGSAEFLTIKNRKLLLSSLNTLNGTSWLDAEVSDRL